MPWWCWSYLVLYAAVSLGGIYDDLRDDRRPLPIASNILAFIFGVGFILAYWDHRVAEVLGKGVLPMLIFTLSADVYSATIDLSKAESGEDISRRSLQYIAGLGVGLVCLPAYIFGGLVAIRMFGLGL